MTSAIKLSRNILDTRDRVRLLDLAEMGVSLAEEVVVENAALSTPNEPVPSELLMMFIRDCYKSTTGKISKSTALATMKYVSGDDELQRLVNISNWGGITNHSPQRELSDDEKLDIWSEIDWDDPDAWREFADKIEAAARGKQ